MGDKLKDYLRRHAEIETRLDKNRCYQFGVSRLNKHYRQLADMLFPGIDVAEYKRKPGINPGFSSLQQSGGYVATGRDNGGGCRGNAVFFCDSLNPFRSA